MTDVDKLRAAKIVQNLRDWAYVLTPSDAKLKNDLLDTAEWIEEAAATQPVGERPSTDEFVRGLEDAAFAAAIRALSPAPASK